MNPLALQFLIVASSVPESWLEPSLSKWPLISTDEIPHAEEPSEIATQQPDAPTPGVNK